MAEKIVISKSMRKHAVERIAVWNIQLLLASQFVSLLIMMVRKIQRTLHFLENRARLALA